MFPNVWSMFCRLDAEAPKLAPVGFSAQDGTPAESQAGLDQDMPDEPLHRRAMCIPSWMWCKVAVTVPVSSKLQLAGVCIYLRDYGHVPQQSSASFGVPASRGIESTSQPVHVSLNNQPAGQLDSKLQESAQASTATFETPQAQAQQSVVTHTLVRQWGAEAAVTILPVGWTKGAEDSASASHSVVAPGQPWNLQTRGYAKLNSIWESHEGSGDDATPTTSSVRSLFENNPTAHQPAQPGHEPGSPGLLFTNRQHNPLCKLLHM